MKKVWLACFVLLSSAGFYSFQASPLVLPGCRDAVFTNVTMSAYNLRLPLNKWVGYCSTFPDPGTGATCDTAATDAEYGSCIASLCPFLPPALAQNPGGITCLMTAVAGESRAARVRRCSETFNEDTEVHCVYPAPQDLTVLADNTATFKTLTGVGAAQSVQWKTSTDGGTNFSPVTGGDALSYSFNALAGLSGNRYRAELTTALGAVSTKSALLTVRSVAQPAERLFVSNGGGQGMVEQYDATNGVFSSDVAPVDVPRGIALNRTDGSLLVVSGTGDQVVKLNGQTGAPLGVFIDGTTACGGSTLNGPAGVAYGPGGHVYVVDQGNNRVVEYDGLTGACHGNYATGATLNQPDGLVFGNDGKLYVANLGGGVALFTSGGTAAGSLAVGTSPAGIAINPVDDKLYVTDRVAAGQVYSIVRSTFPASTPAVFVGSPAGGLVSPEGLVFGPDGHLYVASTGNSKIQKFHSSTGALISTFVDNVPTGIGPTFLTFGASASIVATGATATYSTASQPLTLSAAVTSTLGTVNSGTVVFTVVDTSGQVATQIGSATAPATVSNGSASATFTLPAATPAGSYSVRATYSGNVNFTAVSDNTKLVTVSQATPTITWASPASIQFGSALSNTQLNATGSVPGAFVYTPAAGTVLPAGSGQTLSVQLNPTDSRNYKAVTSSVLINVTAGGPATLISTNTLTRESGTNKVIVSVKIANTGGSAATSVQVNSAAIGAVVSGTVLPMAVANIPAGGSSVVTLQFPASVGIAGARVVLSVAGTYSGGSFGQSARVVLP